MIGRLSGSVVEEDPNGTVTLDVSGVGYDVLVPVGTLGRARREAERTVLHIHTHVREDALDLFGFATVLDRAVFRLLLAVPNVGPKTAIGILSSLSVEELARAVQADDKVRLCKVPGIGKKTGERLVLELRGKLPEVAPSGGHPLPALHDDAAKLQAALTANGFKAAQAEQVVKSLAPQIGQRPLPELLREALGLLTR